MSLALRTLVILTLFSFCSVQTLSQASLTATAIPAAIADGGGTGSIGYPYAVFVRIQGWTSGAGSQAYLKIYSSTNNEYMWTGSAWSNTTTYSAANQPVVTIDAGGNWSGWVHAKHNTGLGASASVRAAKVGATSTNLTSSAKTFSILSMQGGGNGGWIVRSSSSAANKGIVAYAGGAIVGSYRTEDNSIAEGYTYGAGGFKIAVPAGVVDSLVALNDDGSRFTAFAGPWSVTAGQETDASTTATGIGRGIVRVRPNVIQGGSPRTLTFSVLGENPVVLTHVRIAIPSQWTWSHSTTDVAVSGAAGSVVSVAGDTIVVSGLSIAGGDSAQIILSTITAPDTTASVGFGVRTGTHPDSIYNIGAQPSVYVYGIPQPISTVKANDANGVPLKNNRLVTVRGVVTVANEFGGPSYIQDNTGGMAVFGSTFSSAVVRGDEVVVSGLVQPFSGLTEIVNPVLHTLMSSGNDVEPVPVTVGQIAHDGVGGLEEFEGRLVRIDNVSVVGSGAWGSNTNYTIISGGDSAQIRIDNTTDLVGGPIPVSACNIIGVVGQFISASPFIGGYQLMPRTRADIISAGPVIATVPVEGSITPTSLTISWTTTRPGTSALRYGVTSLYELPTVAPDTIMRVSHAVALQGLTPATVYHVQALSVSATDTSRSGDVIVSTASPSSATGAINVYFNKSVRPSAVPSAPAAGDQDLVSLIIRRITNARRSVDVALYSLSGTPGAGTDIAQALIAAWARGVSVRVICEQDNRTTSPLNSLASAGVPLITDGADVVNGGAGLMHNKFAVFDARGGAPESIWVWTGSWNPTESGTNDDYQNAMEIQDPALAGAYLLEFNEMWGSGTASPDPSQSRFGARKTDNTPHRFRIGGRDVESYFSPSDKTSQHIATTLAAAKGSIHFALLTFTRDDIATTLLTVRDAGITVRGIMDNRVDSGSEYDYLLGRGVDLRLKTGPGLLHHKYAIIDVGKPGVVPAVITGSHNWSSSAENSNNENTLIVYDGSVAEQYFQEFAARYYQFGGTDTITVAVREDGSGLPQSMALLQNYPNPFNGMTEIGIAVQGAAASTQHVTVKIYDILGREVSTLLDGPMAPGVYRLRFDAPSLASGVYLYTMRSGGFTDTKKMILVR